MQIVVIVDGASYLVQADSLQEALKVIDLNGAQEVSIRTIDACYSAAPDAAASAPDAIKKLVEEVSQHPTVKEVTGAVKSFADSITQEAKGLSKKVKDDVVPGVVSVVKSFAESVAKEAQGLANKVKDKLKDFPK